MPLMPRCLSAPVTLTSHLRCLPCPLSLLSPDLTQQTTITPELGSHLLSPWTLTLVTLPPPHPGHWHCLPPVIVHSQDILRRESLTDHFNGGGTRAESTRTWAITHNHYGWHFGPSLKFIYQILITFCQNIANISRIVYTFFMQPLHTQNKAEIQKVIIVASC